MLISRDCGYCGGVGRLFDRIIDCEYVDRGELCPNPEHFMHFEIGGRCWLCLGSTRADVFTIAYRWYKARQVTHPKRRSTDG